MYEKKWIRSIQIDKWKFISMKIEFDLLKDILRSSDSCLEKKNEINNQRLFLWELTFFLRIKLI